VGLDLEIPVSAVGIRVDRGSGTTNATGDATVNFGSPFSSVPKIFATIVGSEDGIVRIVSKTVNGVVLKVRRFSHAHSFSDSFTTSGPSDTEWGVIEHGMGQCPAGHALCQGISYSRRKYATSVATHTGSVSGTTGGPSALYQTMNFDWIAVEGP